MKIKKGFVVREVAGEIVAVPTGKLLEELQEVITLTHSAKFVWELLQEDRTIEEITNRVVEKYKIDPEKAKSDVEKFIKILQQKNIIER